VIRTLDGVADDLAQVQRAATVRAAVTQHNDLSAARAEDYEPGAEQDRRYGRGQANVPRDREPSPGEGSGSRPVVSFWIHAALRQQQTHRDLILDLYIGI
jgi:hypothetical protein